MTYFIIGLMSWILGLATALFLYSWLDEREDAYCNIIYNKKLKTSVSWDRLASHNFKNWEEKQKNIARSKDALDVAIKSISRNGEIIFR